MKVLLATEGSEFSDAAIEECCELLPDSSETEVRIVTAIEPTIVPAEPFAASAEFIVGLDAAAHERAEDVAARAEAKIRCRLPDAGSAVSRLVLSGEPAQVIVDEAERWAADLIVVGSHGYGFWKRAFLGSVSNSVVQHAPCSVLVVRHGNVKEH